MGRSFFLRISLCIALLEIVVLIAAVPLPPLTDYPNHLARMALIGGAIDTSPLSHFYLERWHHIVTNLPIDLAAKVLVPLLPLELAGKLVILAAVFLPLAGLVALSRAEMRASPQWQIFFLLFWCPLTFLQGFLNFEIGLGLGLIGAARDGLLRRRGGWRLHLGRLGFAALAFAAHPFGLLLYCALLAAIGFGRDPLGWRWRSLQTRVTAGLKASWICLVVLAVYYAACHRTPGLAAGAPLDLAWFPFDGRVKALLTPLQTYSVAADRLVVLGLAGFVAYGLWRGKIAVHSGLALAAAAFVLMTLLVPAQIGSASCLTYRFPLLALLTLLAGTEVRLRSAPVAAVVALVLVSVHTGAVADLWLRSIPVAAAVERAAASLPPGAKVFAMRAELSPAEERIPAYRHLAAMIVPWGKEFYPGLFATPRIQPIALRPPFDHLADMQGGELMAVDLLRQKTIQPPYKEDVYIRHWRRFDYMLLLCPHGCAGSAANLPNLDLVRDDGQARVYRVRKN